MFESATLTAAPASTRLWSTCAGISGQAMIVGIMLLAPLVSPAVLPNLRSYVTLAPPGPPPPPPPVGAVTVRPRPVATHTLCLICAPVRVPDRVDMKIVDEPPQALADIGVPGGVPGGIPNGVPGGILPSIIGAVPMAPPRPAVIETTPAPPKAAAAPPARVRAGGLVKLAAPVFHPDPVYPKLAVQARIEGVVELEGIVGTDGRIHSLRVLKGHPFLVNAAVEAVKQWVYSPATLNGDLVEVIAPITVTFRLGGR